jgi:hypothetical protein
MMTSLDQSTAVVSSSSSRTAVDTLAWLSDEAFAGDPAHSLLANLRDLADDDWNALPPGAGRSIPDILEHVAWSKWMYDDYAFGSASLQGNQPPLVPPDVAATGPATNSSPYGPGDLARLGRRCVRSGARLRPPSGSRSAR